MAYISPRVLAVGTLGVAATLVVASGAASAFFSSNPLQNHTCTGYGYHSGYGYGYDCTPNPTPVPPTGGSTSGPGGGSSSAQVSTTQNVSVQTPGVRPTTKIFQNFVKNCEHSVKDLSDSRLKSYYDVLQVIDRTNMNRALTRAEFLKLVLNAAKVDVSQESVGMLYTDITDTHSLAKYVAYATRVGMVSGHNGKFRPNDTITRAEAAKVFVNAAGIGLSTSVETFSDVAKTNSLAAYIQTAYDNCLVNGRNTQNGNTTLASGLRVYEPGENITLAETAKVLYNIVH